MLNLITKLTRSSWLNIIISIPALYFSAKFLINSFAEGFYFVGLPFYVIAVFVLIFAVGTLVPGIIGLLNNKS